MRGAARRLIVGLLLWGAPAWAAPSARPAAACRREVVRALRDARATWNRAAAPRTGPRAWSTPGASAWLRGFLRSERPALFARGATPRRALGEASSDPTFGGRHPMAARLIREGWYRAPQRVAGVQRLVDRARRVEATPRATTLSKLEFVSFDLEATGLAYGRPGRSGRFLSGSGEVVQIGYVTFRLTPDGKVVTGQHGTLNIRPDTPLDPEVERITGLTNAQLDADFKAGRAGHFEDQIQPFLKVLEGRIPVGHNMHTSDWRWLRSNLGRLGVDLGEPFGIDTQKLARTTHVAERHGLPTDGLKALSTHYRVGLDRHHDGEADAVATAGVFAAMVRDPKLGGRPPGALSLGDVLAKAGAHLPEPGPYRGPGAPDPS